MKDKSNLSITTLFHQKYIMSEFKVSGDKRTDRRTGIGALLIGFCI